MILRSMQVGMIGTNCYIFADEATKACAVVDPGDDGAHIAQFIQQQGWTPVAILLTHSHFDHIMGGVAIQQVWPELPVWCNSADWGDNATSQTTFGMTVPTVRALNNLTHYGEGDTVQVGNITVKVLETPGHTPGSVTLMAEDVLFTGDTLFCGSMGRTDLPGGNYQQIMASLRRLYKLEGDFKVCPGHDRTSTLERERQGNFFIAQAMEQEMENQEQ